jgi:hypothetical protein
MGSGAYAVDLNPANQKGVTVTQTVPLPPAGNTGTVKFGSVFLTASANPPAAMTVKIFLDGGGFTNLGPIPVDQGRTRIHQVVPGDLAASITFPADATAQSAVAFVEYSTP